jgi:hypothetical protein
MQILCYLMHVRKSEIKNIKSVWKGKFFQYIKDQTENAAPRVAFVSIRKIHSSYRCDLNFGQILKIA